MMLNSCYKVSKWLLKGFYTLLIAASHTRILILDLPFDLRAGKKIVVPQEGKLVPDKAGVGEDGSLAIKFKPTKKKE